VKRLEGKPFALLGVNLDPSRESLRKTEEKHKITWRSFFDGRDGPITRRHNVRSLPTTYVLDANGVIRYKGVQGEAMDRAVDRLLAELEKEAKKWWVAPSAAHGLEVHRDVAARGVRVRADLLVRLSGQRLQLGPRQAPVLDAHLDRKAEAPLLT